MIEEIRKILENKNIKMNRGMTEKEIITAENYYNIKFPIDLKELLMSFLPIGDRFYNWNDYSEENVSKIKDMLQFPIEGIIFDIEEDNFWMDRFGKCPEKIEERVKKFLEYKNKGLIPKLVPIFAHRYMLSDKNINYPVISVYQTDIIYYGADLLEYFDNEFNREDDKPIHILNKEIRPIPFWSEIIEMH